MLIWTRDVAFDNGLVGNFYRSSGQKNLSFMEMMKSAAKGCTQEDELDDEEEFALKKEMSTTTTTTATTPYNGISHS